MKEKIKKLRDKAKEVRVLAKKAYEWNRCTSTAHMRDAIVAIADNQDLLAEMFEQLYSEEEIEEG